MIVFTLPALAPVLLAAGAYYLFALFLSDLAALGVALLLGSLLSAVLELARTRATVFFVPVGAWMALAALNQRFGFLAGFNLLGSPKGEMGVGFTVMAVLTGLFGVLSVVGHIMGRMAKKPADE